MGWMYWFLLLLLSLLSLLSLKCKEIDSAHSGRFLWGDGLCVEYLKGLCIVFFRDFLPLSAKGVVR